MSKETEQSRRGNFIQRPIKRFLKGINVNYEMIGVENLTGVDEKTGREEPENLKSLLSRGESAAIIPNHPSYADFPTNAAIVAKEGLEDFMGGLVISGRYTNSVVLGGPIRAISFALDIEIDSVNPHRYGGDKKNQEMNLKAEKKVRENKVGIAVLEGTHSAQMQSARWGAARWWEGKSYMVPVAFRGTDKQWPGGLKNFFYYVTKGRKEHKATLIIGKPVRVDYMERVAEVYAEGDDDPNALKRNTVDFPMQLIANLHRDYVKERNLEDKTEETKYTEGYYDELSQELIFHPVTVGLNKLNEIDLRQTREETQKQEEQKTEKVGRLYPRTRLSPGWNPT